MSASPSFMERPKRWPLAAQPNNRTVNFFKDARLVNCYAEKDPNTGEFQIEKRIGNSLAYTLSKTGGRGMYPWSPNYGGINSLSNYALAGDGVHCNLYKDGTAIGATNSISDNNAGTPMFSFAETQGAAPRLVFTGISSTGGAVVYNSDGNTTWSLASLPVGASIPLGIVYLDGTLYTMDHFGNIYGSNFNDPTTWPGTNLIVANAVGGAGVYLTYQLNYVIALKENSMEVFYDAGNPTGSPLGKVAGATTNFGCPNSTTVQVIDNILIYVSSNKTLSTRVMRVDSLIPTVISTPAIDKLLASTIGQITYSFVFKISGHRFYGISLSSISPTVTLVYDLDEGLWYQWTDSAGNWFPYISTSMYRTPLHMIQHASNGNVYNFDADYVYPTDNGTVIPVDIYTPSTDFGTRRGKTLHRMYIRSDQTPGSVLYSRRSDDDYQTWSNFRKIDLGNKTPYLDDEGSFVKRAYNFRHAAAVPLRIRSADLQMDFGTI